MNKDCVWVVLLVGICCLILGGYAVRVNKLDGVCAEARCDVRSDVVKQCPVVCALIRE